MEILDGVSFILIFLLGCSKQCKKNQNSTSDFAFTGLLNMQQNIITCSFVLAKMCDTDKAVVLHH